MRAQGNLLLGIDKVLLAPGPEQDPAMSERLWDTVSAEIRSHAEEEGGGREDA